MTYDLQSESNIDTYEAEMKYLDREEADTILVLQAINVTRNDTFAECVINSPNTDVFHLLVHTVVTAGKFLKLCYNFITVVLN